VESISRRKFLRQAGAGVAALGAVSALGTRGVAGIALERDGASEKNERVEPHDGPLVVEIPNPNAGEIHLMFGTEEVVRHDSSLVARLVRASR
jgi:hypothetical protein